MGHSISSLRGRVRPAIATCLAALLAGGLLAACGSSGSAGSASKSLTIWQSGSPGENGLGFIYPAAKAFEKAHPGVKINIVVKPPDNYFALLQAAMLGHTGPDIAEIYPGTYVRNTIPYFVNLNSYVPASTRQTVTGIQYYSKTGNPNSNTYGLPVEDQFYNMWYNKALFANAGIKSPPTDFSQMATDCRLLKAKGITPLADGNPTFTTPAMGPTQDWSYLLADIYSLKQWNGILDGSIPYNSSAVIQQVTRWAGMFKAGCATKSILTENANNLFASGKAAMVMNFNGLYPVYYQSLHSKLGVMVPPWSSTPEHQLIEFPGTGYSVTTSSANPKLAAQFVAFTVSPTAQKLVAATGQIPVISSVPAQTGAGRQLLAMARSGRYELYPMIDNYMPAEVSAQIGNQLPEAFVGQQSASSALANMEGAYTSLPADQQHPHYNLGG